MKACSRTLEITVISGENLYVDQNPVTKDTYVVVRTESLNCCTTKMAMEGGSGSNPSWNEKFLLDMPMHARSITFEVQCKTSKGIKNIGVARIAVSDFLGPNLQENCLQVLSYRLRDWEGRRNGVINFSVRMKTPEECSFFLP